MSIIDRAVIYLPLFVMWLGRSEEHTSELQSRFDIVCRLLGALRLPVYPYTTRFRPTRDGWHASMPVKTPSPYGSPQIQPFLGNRCRPCSHYLEGRSVECECQLLIVLSFIFLCL